MDSLNDLTARLVEFARERDWERFHSPKNLCMALGGEVGELMEHFQWLTEDASRNLPPEKREQVGEGEPAEGAEAGLEEVAAAEAVAVGAKRGHDGGSATLRAGSASSFRKGITDRP